MVDTTPVTTPPPDHDAICERSFACRRDVCTRACIVVAIAAGMTGIASAQVIRLTPVEAGRDDTSPLLTSLHEPATDLRSPVDFEKVYRVTSDTRLLGRPGGRREEMYARVNNGLIAVFPKSSYDGMGGRATVPANTVWMLAETRVDGSGASPRPVDASGPQPTTAGATLLDRRLNQRSLERSLTAEPIEPPPPPRAGVEEASIPCIFDSEEARRSRVSMLLDRAGERHSSRR